MRATVIHGPGDIRVEAGRKALKVLITPDRQP
jgi:hypothetical protein